MRFDGEAAETRGGGEKRSRGFVNQHLIINLYGKWGLWCAGVGITHAAWASSLVARIDQAGLLCSKAMKLDLETRRELSPEEIIEARSELVGRALGLSCKKLGGHRGTPL